MTYPRFNDMLAFLVDASVLRSIDFTIFGMGTLILLAGLCAWLIRGAKDPLRHAPHRVNALTPELAILPFLIWMLGSYLTQGIIAAINVRADSPVISEDLGKLIMATGGQLTGIVACLVVGGFYYREGLSGFGFHRKGFLGDLAVMVLALLVIIPILFLLNKITAGAISLFQEDFDPPQHKLLQSLDVPQQQQPIWAVPMLWISAVLVAPLAEELFFRGVIQTGLRHAFDEGILASPENMPGFPAATHDTDETTESTRDHEDEKMTPSVPVQRVRRSRGKWPAIVVTGFIFGMVHYAQPHAVPSLILFGIVLGYTYEKRGSLMPCIGLHILFNLKTMIWFSLRGPG